MSKNHNNKIERILNGDDSSSGEDSSPILFSHGTYIPFQRVVTAEKEPPGPPINIQTSSSASASASAGASASASASATATTKKNYHWTYKPSSTSTASDFLKPKKLAYYEEDWSSDDGGYGLKLPPPRPGGWLQTKNSPKRIRNTFPGKKELQKKKIQKTYTVVPGTVLEASSGASNKIHTSKNNMDKLEENREIPTGKNKVEQKEEDEEGEEDSADYSSADTDEIYIHHEHANNDMWDELQR